MTHSAGLTQLWVMPDLNVISISTFWINKHKRYLSREECVVAVTNTVNKHEKYEFVQIELIHSIMRALTNYVGKLGSMSERIQHFKNLFAFVLK